MRRSKKHAAGSPPAQSRGSEGSPAPTRAAGGGSGGSRQSPQGVRSGASVQGGQPQQSAHGDGSGQRRGADASGVSAEINQQLQSLQNVLLLLRETLENEPTQEGIEYVDLFLSEAYAGVSQLQQHQQALIEAQDMEQLTEIATADSEFTALQSRAEDWKLHAAQRAGAGSNQRSRSPAGRDADSPALQGDGGRRRRPPRSPGSQDQDRMGGEQDPGVRLPAEREIEWQTQQDRRAMKRRNEAQKALQAALRGEERNDPRILTWALHEAIDAGVGDVDSALVEEGQKALREHEHRARVEAASKKLQAVLESGNVHSTQLRDAVEQAREAGVPPHQLQAAESALSDQEAVENRLRQQEETRVQLLQELHSAIQGADADRLQRTISEARVAGVDELECKRAEGHRKAMVFAQRFIIRPGPFLHAWKEIFGDARAARRELVSAIDSGARAEEVEEKWQDYDSKRIPYDESSQLPDDSPAEAAAPVAPAADVRTKLATSAAAGSLSLDVESQDGFALGCEVSIGEAPGQHEVHVISAFGSIILQTPLEHDYPAGTVISQIPLPSGWYATTDPHTGKRYYYNDAHDVQWTRPGQAEQSAASKPEVRQEPLSKTSRTWEDELALMNKVKEVVPARHRARDMAVCAVASRDLQELQQAKAANEAAGGPREDESTLQEAILHAAKVDQMLTRLDQQLPSIVDMFFDDLERKEKEKKSREREEEQMARDREEQLARERVEDQLAQKQREEQKQAEEAKAAQENHQAQRHADMIHQPKSDAEDQWASLYSSMRTSVDVVRRWFASEAQKEWGAQEFRHAVSPEIKKQPLTSQPPRHYAQQVQSPLATSPHQSPPQHRLHAQQPVFEQPRQAQQIQQMISAQSTPHPTQQQLQHLHHQLQQEQQLQNQLLEELQRQRSQPPAQAAWGVSMPQVTSVQQLPDSVPHLPQAAHGLGSAYVTGGALPTEAVPDSRKPWAGLMGVDGPESYRDMMSAAARLEGFMPRRRYEDPNFWR